MLHKKKTATTAPKVHDQSHTLGGNSNSQFFSFSSYFTHCPRAHTQTLRLPSGPMNQKGADAGRNYWLPVAVSAQ